MTIRRDSLFSSGPAFACVVTADADSVMVQVFGELDLATGRRLCEQTTPDTLHCPERVVFDVTDLDFMDFAGLDALLYSAERLQTGGHHVGLVVGPGASGWLLEVAGQLFDLSWLEISVKELKPHVRRRRCLQRKPWIER